MDQVLHITQNPAISAIYFALLQVGYDFYTLDKDDSLTRRLKDFRETEGDYCHSFFADVRQSSCEVYPYWPRAAALETASFYLNDGCTAFSDFPSFRSKIIAAPNIADHERDEAFWSWIAGFPAALHVILESHRFQTYLAWEDAWIKAQRNVLADDLLSLKRIISLCSSQYHSPIQAVTTVLCPIKCTYASDYHLSGTHLYYIAGSFRADALVHESLHPAVSPIVRANREKVLARDISFPGLDVSYYQSHDDAGRLNAFEEYMVRQLTADLMSGNAPVDLDTYLKHILTIN